MRLLKVVIISLLVVGCSEQTRKELFPTPAQEVSSLRYYKDIRTNLCYAENTFTEGGQLATTGRVFVNVPCTPEVEKLIVVMGR